jgi:hypothetical protein
VWFVFFVVKFSWHQWQDVRFTCLKQKDTNHETHEIHESSLVKKYRFRVDFFRVVRVFRGNVFYWHQWQDVRFTCLKQKDTNHERHEIHESSLVKKYRFRVDFLRVVRVFRGKMVS